MACDLWRWLLRWRALNSGHKYALGQKREILLIPRWKMEVKQFIRLIGTFDRAETGRKDECHTFSRWFTLMGRAAVLCIRATKSIVIKSTSICKHWRGCSVCRGCKESDPLDLILMAYTGNRPCIFVRLDNPFKLQIPAWDFYHKYSSSNLSF